MTTRLFFPETIDVFPGSLVISANIDGSATIIPHVTLVDVDPAGTGSAVAATLCGPKSLNSWRVLDDGCLDQDTIHGLVIPDEPGLPWPCDDAAYRAGCTLFDGRQFVHYNKGDVAIGKFRQAWSSRWRAKRGLPTLKSLPAIPLYSMVENVIPQTNSDKPQSC